MPVTNTLTAYLDNARKVTPEAKPSYIRKAWREGNLWHVKEFRKLPVAPRLLHSGFTLLMVRWGAAWDASCRYPDSPF